MKKILITVVVTILLFIVIVGGGVIVGVNKYFNVKRSIGIDKVVWMKTDGSAWAYLRRTSKIMYVKGIHARDVSVFLSSESKDVMVGGNTTVLTATVSDDRSSVKYSDGSSALLDKNGVVILYRSPKGRVLFNWQALDSHCWAALDRPFWKVDFLSPEATLSKEGG